MLREAFWPCKFFGESYALTKRKQAITHEYEDFLLNPLPKKELQNQQYHMGLKAQIKPISDGTLNEALNTKYALFLKPLSVSGSVHRRYCLLQSMVIRYLQAIGLRALRFEGVTTSFYHYEYLIGYGMLENNINYILKLYLIV